MNTSNIIQEFTFRKGSKILGQLELIQYSDKCIALFGATFEIKDILLSSRGKFNPSLDYQGGKTAGFIFPSWMKKKLIEKLYTPAVAMRYRKNNERAFYQQPVKYRSVLSQDIIEKQNELNLRLR